MNSCARFLRLSSQSSLRSASRRASLWSPPTSRLLAPLSLTTVFLCAIACLAPAPALHAATIHIPAPADSTADATLLIRQAIENAPAGEPLRITLDAATYRVSAGKAAEEFVFVSNHDSGLRRAAFMLQGRRDVEIDGRGARLVLSGQAMMAFEIGDTTNVTIRNLGIDWDRALYLQATVTAIDTAANSVDIDVLPECNARLRDGQLEFGVFGAGDKVHRAPWQLQPAREWRQNLAWTHWVDATSGRSLAALEKLQFSAWNARLGRAAETRQLDKNTYRLTNAFARLPTTGAVLVAKGELIPNRQSPAIHIARCANVLLENVAVHHAGGMGLIVESTSDITLRRFQVRRAGSSPRLVSTTADATHFVQCKGSILVEDCHFENMLDDSINVHGVHAIVESLLAPDKIGARLSHFQQLGMEYVAPGERIRLALHKTLLPYAERVVKEVRRVNASYFELTFTEPVGAVLKPDSIIENADRQPDLVFRRNTVRNNRARSLLVSTGGRVLIEDNRFEHPSGHVVLIEGDAYVWHESGAVSDVLIRNNDIIASSDAAVFKIAPKQPELADAEQEQPPYHRNIRIEENRIATAAGLLVETYRAAGLRFDRNRVRAIEGARIVGTDDASATASAAVAADGRAKAKKGKGKAKATAAAAAAAGTAPGFIFHDTTDVSMRDNDIALPWEVTIIRRTSGQKEIQRLNLKKPQLD